MLDPTTIPTLREALEKAVEVANTILAMTDESDGNEWWCPRCNETVPASHVTYVETHDKDGCGESVYTRDDVPIYPPSLAPMAQSTLALPGLLDELERLQSNYDACKASLDKQTAIAEQCAEEGVAAQEIAARRLEVLRSIEWNGSTWMGDADDTACPFCCGRSPTAVERVGPNAPGIDGAYNGDGHAPDCALARELETP